MTSGMTLGFAGTTLRAVSVAAALACGAGASLAQSNAAVEIRSFTVTAGSDSYFAFAVDAYQMFSMSALEAGGLVPNGSSTDFYEADNWNLGLNRKAQTTSAIATGNTVNFTDDSSQTRAGFELAASATKGSNPPPALPNTANASALQFGAFTLLDEAGKSIGGTITFDVYYNLDVATPNSAYNLYSQSAIQFDLSADGSGNTNQSFRDGLTSTSLAGGIGSISNGHFSYTYTLAAGEYASYNLSGSAIAVAQAIPEPSTYALMALGLAGVGLVARRRRRTAA